MEFICLNRLNKLDTVLTHLRNASIRQWYDSHTYARVLRLPDESGNNHQRLAVRSSLSDSDSQQLNKIEVSRAWDRLLVRTLNLALRRQKSSCDTNIYLRGSRSQTASGPTWSARNFTRTKRYMVSFPSQLVSSLFQKRIFLFKNIIFFFQW